MYYHLTYSVTHLSIFHCLSLPPELQFQWRQRFLSILFTDVLLTLRIVIGREFIINICWMKEQIGFKNVSAWAPSSLPSLVLYKVSKPHWLWDSPRFAPHIPLQPFCLLPSGVLKCHMIATPSQVFWMHYMTRLLDQDSRITLNTLWLVLSQTTQLRPLIPKAKNLSSQISGNWPISEGTVILTWEVRFLLPVSKWTLYICCLIYNTYLYWVVWIHH